MKMVCEGEHQLKEAEPTLEGEQELVFMWDGQVIKREKENKQPNPRARVYNYKKCMKNHTVFKIYISLKMYTLISK
jgi:hypothetical protein